METSVALKWRLHMLSKFKKRSGLNWEQSSLPSYFSGRFSGGAVLNFQPIQNSDRFYEHLGWFKMGKQPSGKVMKCIEL
jgi:hypothetical protein